MGYLSFLSLRTRLDLQRVSNYTASLVQAVEQPTNPANSDKRIRTIWAGVLCTLSTVGLLYLCMKHRRFDHKSALLGVTAFITAASAARLFCDSATPPDESLVAVGLAL